MVRHSVPHQTQAFRGWAGNYGSGVFTHKIPRGTRGLQNQKEKIIMQNNGGGCVNIRSIT